MTRSLRLFTSLALICSLAFAATATSSSAAGLLGGVNMIGGGPDAANFVLSSPGEIRRAPDGTFFVVDSGNHKITRVSATGEYLYSFGGSSGSDAGTTNPLSIALISSGGADPDVLVSTGSYVKRFTAAGAFISKFTSPTPGYLEIDPATGDLYMSDFNAHNVKKIALGDDTCTVGTTEQLGDVVETIGQGAGVSDFLVPGKLWGPRSIAFDSTGRLFVVDRNQRRVTVFKRGNLCDPWVHDTQFGSNSSGNPANMSGARGIAIDRSVVPNKIYVTVDFINHVVLGYSGDTLGEPPFEYRGRWGSAVEDQFVVPGNGPDEMNSPFGIAVNGSDAWVTEAGNDRIHGYAGVSASTPFAAPTTSTLWGRSGREDGYFLISGDIAAAPDGSLFALDRQKRRVQHFAPNGDFLEAWGQDGSGAGQFNFNPSSIAVTPTGEVLVAGGIPGIQRFSASGSYLGTITWEQQSPPNEIAPGVIRLDADGNIWMWDNSAQKIVKISSSGTVLTSFGNPGFSAGDTISNVVDLAVSDDGLTVYVVDQPTNLVKKFSSVDGINFTFELASQPSMGAGTNDGFFSGPSSMAIDPVSGEIAVIDAGNNRVQRFAASNLAFVSKIGSLGHDEDELVDPFGLAFDQWGNMWLGDHGSDRIKRYGEAPVITLASQPASTTNASAALNYEVTDPAADCSPASGTTMPLTLGENSLVVTCTNAEGTDVETLMITRTVPPVVPPADPPASPPTVAEASLKLPKKFKLTKSRKLKFSVTCPAGCTVTPKLLFGKKSSRIKQVRKPASAAAQPVTIKLSSTQGAKAKAWMVNNKTVYLTVTVQAYGAKLGKSGRAKLSR